MVNVKARRRMASPRNTRVSAVPKEGADRDRLADIERARLSQRDRTSRLSQRAYEVIKRLILTNQLQGGANVLEDDLAGMLGMSRTPLREALVKLQNEGLIQIVPRRGIRVVALTVADMGEIYDLLQCLEAHAARLIARRPDRAAIVRELDGLVGEMRRALTADNLEAWGEANERFHRRLVAGAGNQRLEQYCQNLLDQSHRVRVFTLRLRRPPHRSTDSQAEMVAAIRRGDEEAAYRIQARHKGEWIEELTEIVARLQLKWL